MRLSLALLLLILLGSPNAEIREDPITGPGAVSGPEGGSLTVRCHYNPEWKTHRKLWCRGAEWAACKILVETAGTEEEVKKDRVSIRDSWKDYTFNVTMEVLRRDDADTYWCIIQRTGIDKGVQVKVTIDPVPQSSAPERTTTAARTTTGSSPTVISSTSGRTPSTLSRSFLTSPFFLILVLLELPLLLSMLSAVLWVNRPQRSSAGRPGWPDDAH
ncbi:CMRF35-like molecule 4 [Otolemur garnettii]|uniref:CMRF35-like molecule 4 n=1 Tax=Otolemur garnettii TaxID=30611 RepID=UPI0006441AEB|nr:CMRF35-like molecule 4 [Otolemur garnettii]